MKVFIITLGCKVNQYESQAMMARLEEKNFESCENEKSADIIIINSCTVTAASDQKVRQTLRGARKANESAVIVLTGCMPQAFPEESGKLQDADIILGNTSRKNIDMYIEKFLSDRERIIDIREHETGEVFEPLSVANFHGRTRAFLKIEDGCNRFCSYCIIPYARGRVRSKPIEEIKTEVHKIAQSGYREIVLTGINLSSYGDDIGLSLCDAVDAVCEEEDILRVRLGSLEPERLEPNVIERLGAQKKLCPQFHLSLQSGSAATLCRMNRHYTPDEYMKIVSDLRAVFRGASITTDVMVGFSGESEEEFEQSLDFVKRAEFARVHVFKYSRRPGTKAYNFSGAVSNSEKERRSRQMIKVTDESMLRFHASQCGTVCDVLFEQRDKDGLFEGYTANYTLVKVRSDKNLHGMLLPVYITKAETRFCIGEISENIN